MEINNPPGTAENARHDGKARSWRWRPVFQTQPILRGIRARIVFWFLVAASLPLVLSIFIFFRIGITAMQSALGDNFRAVAVQASRQVDAILEREIAWISQTILDGQILVWLEEVNRTYGNGDAQNINAIMKQREKHFQSGELRQTILENRLSQRLAILVGVHPSAVASVSLIDRHGGLVAASHPVSRYDHRSLKWFATFFGGPGRGAFIDTLVEDGKSVVDLVIPIFGGLEVTGALRVLYEEHRFFMPVTGLNLGQTGWAMLAVAGGTPLTLVNRTHHSTDYARMALVHSAKSPSGWLLNRDDRTLLGPGILGYARVEVATRLQSRYDGATWYVMISQSAAETYQGVRDSLYRVGLAGAAVVNLLGIIGVVVARHISAPLLALRHSVMAFAKGTGIREVSARTEDEIQDLVNEFQKMAIRIRDSENRLKAFADAVRFSGDSILMTDAQNRTYYVNPAFEALTGYPLADVLGKDPGELASGSTNPVIYHALWKCLNQHKPWRGEMINRRRNGSHYNAELTINPILDAGKKTIGYISVQRDITGVKRRRQELEVAKKKLELEVTQRTRQLAEAEKLAEIGRMATMIAHDIRNPLSAVKMNLQILLAALGEMLEVDEAEHFHIALEQVRYLEGVLSSLLSFARPGTLNKEWVELPRILESALIMVEPRIKASGTQIHFEWPESLPTLYGDSIQLRQMFVNLLTNAIQAMHKNPEPELFLRAQRREGPEPGEVLVTIEDRGGGILPDVADQMFEPFVSGHAKGTGLGLAIVRRIARGHGGEVVLEPAQPRGVRARVVLPVQPAGEPWAGSS